MAISPLSSLRDVPDSFLDEIMDFRKYLKTYLIVSFKDFCSDEIPFRLTLNTIPNPSDK